jgi:hypothetical protein
MTDRPPMPQETVAMRAAFCAGVKGLRYTENPDPEAAYEVGRALRMIGHILDSQSSPVEHGRHFLAQLANAMLTFAMRGERQPWGAEDTAFVFREDVQGRTRGRPEGVRRHPRLRAQTADRQSEIAPALARIGKNIPASACAPHRKIIAISFLELGTRLALSDKSLCKSRTCFFVEPNRPPNLLRSQLFCHLECLYPAAGCVRLAQI